MDAVFRWWLRTIKFIVLCDLFVPWKLCLAWAWRCQVWSILTVLLLSSNHKLEICLRSLRKRDTHNEVKICGAKDLENCCQKLAFGSLCFSSVWIFLCLLTFWPFGSTYLFLHQLDYTIIPLGYNWFLTPIMTGWADTFTHRRILN